MVWINSMKCAACGKQTKVNVKKTEDTKILHDLFKAFSKGWVCSWSCPKFDEYMEILQQKKELK